MTDLRRVLTDHATHRYHTRVDRTATPAHIQTVLDEATVRHTPPGILNPDESADAWAVNGQVVFPLHHRDGVWLATTCLRKRKRCKADCRAMREWAREEAEEMAA